MASVKYPTLKVILLGEYGVGKSSLFRRYVFNTYVDSRDKRSTLGFDHYEKLFKVEGKELLIQLWDTGGLERVASITTNYFKYAEAVILVFSHDSLESFQMLSQHLLEILSKAENAKIFICGNQKDLESLGTGPSQELVNAFMSEYQVSETENLIKKLYNVSCKTNDGVTEMFDDIATILSRSVRCEVEPVEHFQLRRLSNPNPERSCCGGNGSNSS